MLARYLACSSELRLARVVSRQWYSAHWMSIQSVYRLCVFLPVIGLLTAVLPYIEEHKVHGDLGCMIWHRYAMVGIA